jgi:hypothetical protein
MTPGSGRSRLSMSGTSMGQQMPPAYTLVVASGPLPVATHVPRHRVPHKLRGKPVSNRDAARNKTCLECSSDGDQHPPAAHLWWWCCFVLRHHPSCPSRCRPAPGRISRRGATLGCNRPISRLHAARDLHAFCPEVLLRSSAPDRICECNATSSAAKPTHICMKSRADAHPPAAQHCNTPVGHHCSGHVPQAAGRAAQSGAHMVQLVAHLSHRMTHE